MKRNTVHLQLIMITVVMISQLLSQVPAYITPEEVGLSATRLDRIRPLMQSYIESGKLAGLMTFVARDGEIVHFETYGMQDLESKTALTRETIFRIYSMSKPITSTAVMMLYEEGQFLLNDPVSKYIPEFKNLKVFAGGTVRRPQLIEPAREITIHDLLRHTAGFTYTWGSTAVDSLYRQKKVFDRNDTLHDFIVKLSEIPLLYQPGTRFHYSVSIDVLGYLVQVVSGMPFDQFLQRRIFEPLGMNDTGFYVPADKLDRLATRYEKTDQQALKVGDHPQTSTYQKPPKAPSGGGGLVSTAMDYYRFAQMILNKGEFEGNRLLGRQTVEYMLQNHLSEGLEVGPGEGFGIGFGIATDPIKSEILCSPGEAAWSGAANTFFWIDPAENLVYMVWTQLFPWGPYDYRHQFRVMVHAAIID